MIYDFIDKLEKEELNERMRILNEENNFLANNLRDLNVNNNIELVSNNEA